MQRTRVLAAGLLVFAWACSSSPTTSSSALDALITSDVATMSADATTEDVDVMAAMDGDIGVLVSAPLADGMFLTPPNGPRLTGCTFANGLFTCPPVTRNGLTINRTVVFKDANGATQSAYDAATTASIHVVASVSGDVTRGPMTASVSRNRDFTISGLAGTETTRTVNGTGSETVSHSSVSATNETRSYSLTGSSIVANVVVPVRGEGVDPWPLSGTITRTYTVTRTNGSGSGHTVTRTVVVTFNGTSTPTATVNGESFTLDLAHRTATHR
jgi:hypothetical protein